MDGLVKQMRNGIMHEQLIRIAGYGKQWKSMVVTSWRIWHSGNGN